MCLTTEMNMLGGLSDTDTNAPALRDYAKLVDLPQVSCLVFHRFLWEQIVARKIEACKLFSQRCFHSRLLWDQKAAAGSLQIFTFGILRAIITEQTFANFPRTESVEQNVSRRDLSPSTSSIHAKPHS